MIRETTAKSILSSVSGFLREAGFTHSLTPARNCTYGCAYCYVPTMRIFGGLKAEDWTHWGQWTTFKTNAAELLRHSKLKINIIYCSPLVDPYQPAERTRQLMPEILQQLIVQPPKIFVLQTRSPLVLRDLPLLQQLNKLTTVRISFSVTTNRAAVERRYEPRCESNQERLAAISILNEAGIEAYATLAPLLPCDPEILAQQALKASNRRLIGDGLHNREEKPQGAGTRETAWRIAEKFGDLDWFQPRFQQKVIAAIQQTAQAAGQSFTTGPQGFAWLARDPEPSASSDHFSEHAKITGGS